MVCSFLWCDTLVVIALSDKPRQNQGRGLVDRQLVQASPPPSPRNFIAGRPKAALLFFFVFFFCGFRCGVPLFIVFLLYINKQIGKNRC